MTKPSKGASKLAPFVVFGAILVIALVGVGLVLSQYDDQPVDRELAPPEIREPAPEIEEIPEDDRPDGPDLEPQRTPDPGPYPPPNPD